jgi:Tol biopolymer transport system component
MYKLNWSQNAFVLSSSLTAGDRLYAPGPPSWSPDGQWLAYGWAGATVNQIWLQAGAGLPARPLAPYPVVVEATDGVDRRDMGGGPQWSPDGRRIAFVGESARSGPGAQAFLSLTSSLEMCIN